jgi:hypothetical protein
MGLWLPKIAAAADGNPKIPAPMMKFTISAVKLHGPIARTNVVVLDSIEVHRHGPFHPERVYREFPE